MKNKRRSVNRLVFCSIRMLLATCLVFNSSVLVSSISAQIMSSIEIEVCFSALIRSEINAADCSRAYTIICNDCTWALARRHRVRRALTCLNCDVSGVHLSARISTTLLNNVTRTNQAYLELICVWFRQIYLACRLWLFGGHCETIQEVLCALSARCKCNYSYPMKVH